MNGWIKKKWYQGTCSISGILKESIQVVEIYNIFYRMAPIMTVYEPKNECLINGGLSNTETMDPIIQTRFKKTLTCGLVVNVKIIIYERLSLFPKLVMIHCEKPWKQIPRHLLFLSNMACSPFLYKLKVIDKLPSIIILLNVVVTHFIIHVRWRQHTKKQTSHSNRFPSITFLSVHSNT